MTMSDPVKPEAADREQAASKMPPKATAMEARSADHLPTGPGWWYEPKWDGFRCLAFRRAAVVLQAKSGKPLTRYFPEVVAALAAIPEEGFAIDGELLIPSATASRSRRCRCACTPPKAASAAGG
jgi:ATP-dependent DNA ligase